MKKLLDKENNFIDYFVTIGIENDTIFNSSLYDYAELGDYTKLEEIITPKIINKFPDFDKSLISIDDSLISACFPNGFKPTYSKVPPSEKQFTMILDNSFYGIEFP